jgi:hypothetical protein
MAFFFVAGLAFAARFVFRGRAGAVRRAAGRLFLVLGRVVLEAAARRFGADALFAFPAFRGAARLAAFFFWILAFRTGFLAIPDSLSECLPHDPRRLTERP